MTRLVRSESPTILFTAYIAFLLLTEVAPAQLQPQVASEPSLKVSVLDGDTPIVNPLTLLLKVESERESEVTTSLLPEQFQIFVIPHGHSLQENEAIQYRAAGVFVVYLHNSYFLDIRRLPIPLAKGDYDLLVRTMKDNRALVERRVQNAIHYTRGGRDVAILLDESNGILKRGTESDKLAKIFSETFSVFSDPRSAINKLGIISFGVKTRALLPLTRPSEKEQLSKAISTIGNTRPANITEAVQLASKQLTASPAQEKMLILIAGQEAKSENYKSVYAPLEEKGWAVHVIDLPAMFQTLEMDKTPQRTLKRIFEEICFRLQNEQTIWIQHIAAPLDGEKTFDVPIDSSVRSVKFVCSTQQEVPSSRESSQTTNPREPSRRESNPGVQLTLTDPQGATPPIAEAKGLIYPTVGIWRIGIRNDTNNPPTRTLTIRVIADTSLFLRAIPLKNAYEIGEPMGVACCLADGTEPIANASVEVQIIKPDGNSVSMTLTEVTVSAGKRANARKGIYVGTFTDTNLPGDYKLIFMAQGKTARGGAFERKAVVNTSVSKGSRFRFWTVTDLLDFGEMYNGEEKSQLLKVELMAKEGRLVRIEKSDFLRHDAQVFPKDFLKITPPVTEVVRDKLDVLDIALRVPEDQKAGTYMGHLKFASEYDERALPIRVVVRSPRIIVEPKEFNLIVSLDDAGSQIERKLFARLSPGGNQTAHVRDDGFARKTDENIEPPAAIKISPAELTLSTENSEIKVTIDISSGVTLGNYESSIVITTPTDEERVPVTLSVRPAVAVGGIDWWRLALVTALLLLILAILIAWLLSKRFQLQPHYMLKYFAVSGLIHLILLILCLYILVETKVIKVEDISPVLAVKMKQLGGKFGIGLPQKITLADQAITLAEKERRLNFTRREVEKSEESGKLKRAVVPEATRVAARHLEPLNLRNPLTDEAKPIPTEVKKKLTIREESEPIFTNTDKVAEKFTTEKQTVVKAAEISLDRKFKEPDFAETIPKHQMDKKEAILEETTPRQFHPAESAKRADSSIAEPLTLLLHDKVPDQLNNTATELQYLVKMESPVNEKHLDTTPMVEYAEARQTRIAKRSVDVQRVTSVKQISRSVKEFLKYQQSDNRLIINNSFLRKPETIELAEADVAFPTTTFERSGRKNVMTDTLRQMIEPEAVKEKKVAVPLAERTDGERHLHKRRIARAVVHTSEQGGKVKAKAVAPLADVAATFRVEPKAETYPNLAANQFEGTQPTVSKKPPSTPLDEAPLAEAPPVKEKKRREQPPTKPEFAKRFAALSPPHLIREKETSMGKERAITEPVVKQIDTEVAATVSLPSIKSPVSAPIELHYLGSRFPKKSAQSAGTAVITLVSYEGGDWNCNPTALPNLAYQLEKRTASVIETRSQTIALSDPRLGKAPFIFMTGHHDFKFTTQEIVNLRAYLEGGGHLWADDCTDEGDLTFDTAFRREIAKVLPGKRLQRLPQTFPVFYSCYDLTKGYKGYRIPPGDKYRLSYLEGIELDGRIAVVYSRNDYGCGLEIDPSTAPLMKSLTDLSPEDMQEGSIRMGINMVLYFMGEWKGGMELKKDLVGKVTQTMRREVVLRQIDEKSYKGGRSTLFDDFDEYNQWQVEEGWGDPATANVRWIKDPYTNTTSRQLEINFSLAQKRKAAVVRYVQVDLSDKDWCVMNVYSDLKGGARISLGLITGIDGQYFEARPLYIKPGFNKDVAFNLKAEAFKCQATGWRYTTKIANPNLIRRIVILIYPGEPHGRIRIDDIRFVTVE